MEIKLYDRKIENTKSPVLFQTEYIGQPSIFFLCHCSVFLIRLNKGTISYKIDLTSPGKRLLSGLDRKWIFTFICRSKMLQNCGQNFSIDSCTFLRCTKLFYTRNCCKLFYHFANRFRFICTWYIPNSVGKVIMQ